MLLATALALFFVVHSFAFWRTQRQALIDAISYPIYRVLFSLSAFGIVYLGVLGWNDFPVIYLYEPSPIFKQLHLILMLPAFYLWVAARGPSHVKRYIKHPMLTGILIWGLGHLLANGDTRSMLLFVSMMLFAAVSMPIIDRRKEEPVALSPSIVFDMFSLVLGLTLYVLMAKYHGTLIGVPVTQYFPF